MTCSRYAQIDQHGFHQKPRYERARGDVRLEEIVDRTAADADENHSGSQHCARTSLLDMNAKGMLPNSAGSLPHTKLNMHSDYLRLVTKSPGNLQHRLLPPLRPSSALNSPRDIQKLNKEREEAVRQEFYKERDELEQGMEKAFAIHVKQLTIAGQERMFHELDMRRERYLRKAMQDAELAHRGMRAEEVTVVTTGSLPGHKVQNILGAVVGSHVMRCAPIDARILHPRN